MFRPTIFGKYLLTHRLAVGGMAEIYKSKVFGVGGFEKDLVVKQILPQYAKYREFIDMFIDEAKITVSLNHGNIVPVYELGRIEGIYFIAMEYVAGRDLSQVMLRAAELDLHFTPEQAVAVIIDVLKGLDYAHRRKDRRGEPMGIVHRDVSPQNVMVSFDGEVKILDFGIAKAAQRLVATHPGAVRGKFGYLAPEQADGKDADRRADIFSTGAVLWELLTGQRLFGKGSEADALEQIRRAVVEPPSTVNPIVPEPLDDIVLRALQKAPDARYKDAGAFQLALSKFLYSSGGAVTSESIGEYVKRIFAEHLDAEQAAEQDPKHLAEVERLEQELAEKLKGQATDPGRRRRRTKQGRSPRATVQGLPAARLERTPTQLRHGAPLVETTPAPRLQSGSRTPIRPLAISGDVDQEGGTLPINGPLTADRLGELSAADLASAADPNFELDAFLDELGPAAVTQRESPDVASKSALQYEVFASREADLEESIFAGERRSYPVVWILAAAVLLIFTGWLLATQTRLFRGEKKRKAKPTQTQVTGHVVVKVRPEFDRSATVPVRYRIYWFQGNSPTTVTDLPLGQRHRLFVELAGYRPAWLEVPKDAWAPRPGHPGASNAWERKVLVRLTEGAGKPAAPQVLRPPAKATSPPPGHTGRLVVETEPAGAQVWLLVGYEFRAEHLDPKRYHRFMGLSKLERGRRILNIRPYKNADNPGDWRVDPEGGQVVRYEGALQMK